MRKVIKHGKYYKEKEVVYYVRCPECNLKIHFDPDYPRVLVCKCGCAFEFEDEDVGYLKKGWNL